MGHVQLRQVPLPVGTITAPLSLVIAFFDNHAIGLSRLVEALGREDPTTERAAYAVSALRDALAEVPVAELDMVATTTSAVGDPYAALSWYGARITDLAEGMLADIERRSE
jgi:hypothetical protein